MENVWILSQLPPDFANALSGLGMMFAIVLAFFVFECLRALGRSR